MYACDPTKNKEESQREITGANERGRNTHTETERESEKARGMLAGMN